MIVVALLLVLLLLHQVYATRAARRERRDIFLAALARTPAEFEYLRKGPDQGPSCTLDP